MRRLCLLGIMAALARPLWAVAGQRIEPPANAPAKVEWNAEQGRLRLRYHGVTVLDATIAVEDPAGGKALGSAVKLESSETAGEKVEQRLKFFTAEATEDAELILRGTVVTSEEGFPAETQSGAQKRFPYVRNSVGLSRNLRNNAVYDRRWDWVLIGPADGRSRIQPKGDQDRKRSFNFENKGQSIELIFRPRYYQKHKDLEHFKPWTYKVWKDPVVGYCTWWAYRGGFTQETLDAMLELFVEKHLPDFGYEYMQFDDTYQQGNGSCPENWLNWDKRKFPGGWEYSIKAIRDAGMKPGIWVHRVHRPGDPHVADIAKEHPDWFVHKTDGSLFSSHGFYVLDTTNEEAVDNMVRKLYRGLREQGWNYVKIDGTGDLLRAYRNKECADFFDKNPTTPEQSLRKWDIVAREELGPGVYMLACHTVGNARHVIGLVDGARLSNDGFQPRTLAQYNFMEGVVWRNDPDHCDVLGEWLMDKDAEMSVFGVDGPVPARSIIRPAICTMAGGVLMLSDKLDVYQDDRNIEGMKRSAPVLFTVPGQLYSCERRPIPCWLQEIERPFDHWSVLARIQWGRKREKEWVFDFKGLPRQEVKFADLGLEADREYLVCEFWNQEFLGKFKGSFTAPAMDANTGMDVFAIREARPHPWVISTSRHISQGGVSLLDEAWDEATNTLSGRSAVVVGDPYLMTVHLPQGFRIDGAEVVGEKPETTNYEETAAVRVVPSATGTVEWRIAFAKSVPPVAPNDLDALKADMAFFTEPSCSQLKTAVKLKDLDHFKSDLLKTVAARMLNGTYDRTYRAAAYEAYPSTRELARTLKLGDGFSRYENITGICLDAGENVVFVGDTTGKKLSLLIPDWMRKPAPGIRPSKDPNGWGLHKQRIELKKGVNVVNVKKGGNVYVSYFDDHAETAPNITVHFPTGKVNGFFDISKHTNADWDRLLDQAVSPIMDARGKHIQVAYPVQWFNVYTRGTGVELINNYDALLNSHYTLMGLVKYNKVPRNRILARVNFNYYMFRDGDGVAYLGNKGTMRMVADPNVVITGDPCWGFCHETGHVLQMRPQMTWGGMTEVSCNIFSMYTVTGMGNKSRLAAQKNYASARKNIIEARPKKSFLECRNVFDRLVPFWQLHLYFARIGRPDFYADVMEEMRRRPDAGRGGESIRNQFEFVKICCDVARLDLTDFFDKWGFFHVGEITVRDYRNYHYTITQQMVDEARAYIAEKQYEKPIDDITLIED
ncbi:MAG: M60 family metallopeptidase [Phycisphaerales bacterium]|nr:MAG: M60 family metallopeptidase [Phycisphaerales bacterium]